MSPRKKPNAHNSTARTTRRQQPAPTQIKTKKAKKPASSKLTLTLSVVAFGVFWWLCSITLGDAFFLASQESYVSNSAMQMKALTDVDFGTLFYAARWPLALYKYPLIGGLLLASILVLTGFLTNRLLRLKTALQPLGYLVPAAVLTYFSLRGFNIYYLNEQSKIFLFPTLLLAILAALCIARQLLQRDAAPRLLPASVRKGLILTIGLTVLIGIIVSYATLPAGCATALSAGILVLGLSLILAIDTRKREEQASIKVIALGAMLTLCGGIGLAVFADSQMNNVIVTGRCVRLLEEGKFEEMAEAALKAKRPSRSVAAYYAIALEEQDYLLNALFDFTFDYPKIKFDTPERSDEYVLFVADCNLACGLAAPAYHHAFERTVIEGIGTHRLKTMALSAIVMGEKELSKKLMRVLAKAPFTDDFVEQYSPMIDQPGLIEQNESLARIKKRNSELIDRAFEQNFQRPPFLGYSMHAMPRSKEQFCNTIAAILYSKDLNAFMQIVHGFPENNIAMPQAVQEALTLCILTKPGGEALRTQFKNLDPQTEQRAMAFLKDVKPIIDRQHKAAQAKGLKPDAKGKYNYDEETDVANKKEMRDALHDTWVGTYYYYYYCENNNPDQVKKTSSSAGVN